MTEDPQITFTAKLENSWRIYNDIQFQIRYADRKVQILLAIGLSLISVFLPKLHSIIDNLSTFTIIALIGLTISALLFFSFVLLALFARGTKVPTQKTPPITFFGHIIEYNSPIEYSKTVKNSTPEDILDDLNSQIYQISHIVMKKYKYYQKSWITLLITITFLIILSLSKFM